jgi:phage terminase small subunit
MDKKKLKEKLHRQIDDLEEEMALQMLHEAAAEYAKTEKDDVADELTPEQVERLNESLRQLDNGQWKTHEEVMKLSKTWLTK